MASHPFTIGFARRGFSWSGGAETYLKRLAGGLVERGHEPRLFTTSNWPPNEWSFGPITNLRASSALGFADALERVRTTSGCDVLMSLERVWSCDVYRAGDGVHRAWLERRNAAAGPLRKIAQLFNRKHGEILRLEASLFGERKARRVIANSEMVKAEIVSSYGFPAERISVIYNGIPLGPYREARSAREETRATLGLRSDDLAVLFVGSGWERKGLRYAIEAVEACENPRVRLLVAGRGDAAKYGSRRVNFLGVVQDVPKLYGAADLFLLPTLYDPFSNACLEAMASGLPVITTRSNGFAEIITEDVHGSAVEDAQDVAGITRALTRWSDAARREEVRPRIYARAAEFAIARNVEQTLDVLAQASTDGRSGKIRNT